MKNSIMKRIPVGILPLLVFSLSCFYTFAQKPSSGLTFVFMGDLHYSLTNLARTDSLVNAVAAEMKQEKNKPGFMILTGDFFHASGGVNIADEALTAFTRFRKDIGIPFYIARGNHDSKVQYEKNALPLFSGELGRDISRSYYSFDIDNCHFAMIDGNEKNLDEMLQWLDKDLQSARSNPAIKHIFAAAHEPLWIVARAGFTNAEYAEKAAKILAKYKVDAYFCGHTHNKTVTVRPIGNQPVTQIMDAAVVEKGRLFMLAPFLKRVGVKPADQARPGILPLEEAHMIFIPEKEKKYYWGYQEGSTTSYYVITVDGKSVKADWHVLGQGVVRSFKWSEPGIITDLKKPPVLRKEPVKENDLKTISKAWIYAAPWIEKDSVVAPFRINGVPVGTFKFDRKRMAGSPFWNKIEVPLNGQALKAIRLNNEISISNFAGSKFGLAHIFILVQFSDGRIAKSGIAPKVLTSFDPSGGSFPDFPADELIDKVKTGEDLAKVNLSFGKYY
jgi:predicted phosphodiesterase